MSDWLCVPADTRVPFVAARRKLASPEERAIVRHYRRSSRLQESRPSGLRLRQRRPRQSERHRPDSGECGERCESQWGRHDGSPARQRARHGSPFRAQRFSMRP